MSFPTLELRLGFDAILWAFFFALSCYSAIFGSKSKISLVSLFVSLTIALAGLEVWMVFQPNFLAGSMILPNMIVILMVAFATSSILVALKGMFAIARYERPPIEKPKSEYEIVRARRDAIWGLSAVIFTVGILIAGYGLALQVEKWELAWNFFMAMGLVLVYASIGIHMVLIRWFAPIKDWEL